MKPEAFYAKVLATSYQPAERRVKGMNHLHLECMQLYLDAVRTIDDEKAAKPGADGRTIAQIVGHIMEWERYTAQAVGEIIAGVKDPQIMHSKGFMEPDGRVINFKGTDDFNHYQAIKHEKMPWKTIQANAIRISLALQGIFSQPVILPYDLLEIITFLS